MNRIAIAVAASVGLAGCVAQTLPPTLTLDQRTCLNSIDFSRALPLAANGNPVKVTVDDNTACLQTSGMRHAFVLFRLPDSPEPTLISVSSIVTGGTLFAPHLALLDSSGTSMREIGREAFVFRGMSLNAGLRPREGERYLLVYSDPATVGQQESRIVGLTQASAVAAGPVIVSVYSGNEMTLGHTLAHNGTIEVSLRPVPKTN
jgi:hypothetical protein